MGSSLAIDVATMILRKIAGKDILGYVKAMETFIPLFRRNENLLFICELYSIIL